MVAVFQRDGRPPDPAVLRRMMDSISHRGPDGRATHVEGPVALGFLRLATTPASFAEPMPMTLPDANGVWALFDGRLDDRDDLVEALRQAGDSPRGHADGELVLRAYRRWGEGFAERLAGDFAAILWDPRRRKLLCIRDPMGHKPFCYHLSDRLLVCASEVRAVIEHPAVSREPNEGMVAEYLAAAMVSKEETLYREIQRLPPGQILVVRPDSVWKAPFFTLSLTEDENRGGSDQQAEELGGIVRKAVLNRMRAPGPVGLALSGGLDSSSVAVVAAALRRENTLLPALELFSQVFPGRACDETPFIRDVVSVTGAPAVELPPGAQPAGAQAASFARAGQCFPAYPNCLNAHGLVAAASLRGIRVLLSGIGGDDWLQSGYHAHGTIEQMARLDPRRAFRTLLSSGQPTVELRRTAGVLAGQLLPPGLWRAIARRRRSRRIPAWIDPRLSRRVGLAERLAALPARVPLTLIGRQYAHDTGTSGWKIHTLEQEELECATLGIEHRAPLDDVALARFALRLPEVARARGRHTKAILRRALAGLLPVSVANRTDKAEFRHLFREALDHHRTTLICPDPLVSRGWLRPDASRMLVKEDDGDVWERWMVVGLSHWLSTQETPLDHT